MYLNDISDISMDFKKNPSFQEKPMTKFYDNASEDLSMLKDIISNRSNKKNDSKDLFN